MLIKTLGETGREDTLRVLSRQRGLMASLVNERQSSLIGVDWQAGLCRYGGET